MNKVWDKVTFLTSSSTGQPVSALENNDGCYLVGFATTAGIGGDKTQPNWDPGDSTFDYWIVEYCDSVLTGITETAGDIHFAIYPNPTTREVSIMLQKDGLKDADFTLTNTSGQLIYHSDETNLARTYTKILDLGTLPAGVYLLDVIADGQRITRKIAKE